MKSIWKLAVTGTIALFPHHVAHAQDDRCARIDEPSARLACYDRQSGRAAPDSRPIPLPTPASAASAATIDGYQDHRDALKSRTDFDSRLKTAIPLRHGYYRLELEDGTAYNTTTVGPPPSVGAEIHVRRTPFGTTFFDLEGRKPLTVRLSRRQ